MNITNHTDTDLSEFIEVVKRFLPFAQKNIGFNKPPQIDLISDNQNAQDMMGKTAYYDPDSIKVVVFTDNRHPKDMLRSISHELVHHAQNCNGEFANSRPMGEDYAQTDSHLRSMEEDANLRGNMTVRDFVDQKLHLEETQRRNKQMATEKQLRNAIRKIIMEELDVNDAVYHRDDEGDEDYSIGAREAEEMTPEELAHRMRTLVDAFVEKMGVETAPPGMTDRGKEELARHLKGDFGRKKSAAEKAAEADFVAAGGDEEVEVEEEEAVVGENILKLVKEGRRRRRRRAAVLRAQRGEKAPEPKVAVKAPEPAKKAEEAVPAGNHRPAAPAAEEVVKSEKKVVKESTDKEWYEGELFAKLLKEAVK